MSTEGNNTPDSILSWRLRQAERNIEAMEQKFTIRQEKVDLKFEHIELVLNQSKLDHSKLVDAFTVLSEVVKTNNERVAGNTRILLGLTTALALAAIGFAFNVLQGLGKF